MLLSLIGVLQPPLLTSPCSPRPGERCSTSCPAPPTRSGRNSSASSSEQQYSRRRRYSESLSGLPTTRMRLQTSKRPHGDLRTLPRELLTRSRRSSLSSPRTRNSRSVAFGDSGPLPQTTSAPHLRIPVTRGGVSRICSSTSGGPIGRIRTVSTPKRYSSWPSVFKIQSVLRMRPGQWLSSVQHWIDWETQVWPIGDSSRFGISRWPSILLRLPAVGDWSLSASKASRSVKNLRRPLPHFTKSAGSLAHQEAHLEKT